MYYEWKRRIFYSTFSWNRPLSFFFFFFFLFFYTLIIISWYQHIWYTTSLSSSNTFWLQTECLIYLTSSYSFLLNVSAYEVVLESISLLKGYVWRCIHTYTTYLDIYIFPSRVLIWPQIWLLWPLFPSSSHAKREEDIAIIFATPKRTSYYVHIQREREREVLTHIGYPSSQRTAQGTNSNWAKVTVVYSLLTTLRDMIMH